MINAGKTYVLLAGRTASLSHWPSFSTSYVTHSITILLLLIRSSWW